MSISARAVRSIRDRPRFESRNHTWKDTTMRKIVAALFVTLDGVVEAPEAWTGPYFCPEIGQEIAAQQTQADTLLLGRKTYETFAAAFAGQSGGIADVMNNVPKLVASTTLTDLHWRNSTLLTGDVPTRLAELKQQDGKNINISGSATLIRSLLRAGMVDELRLQLFPVVTGRGARLFDEYDEQLTLSLTESTVYPTGAINLVYQPAASG
jgi:dihydrofolate reductase